MMKNQYIYVYKTKNHYHWWILFLVTIVLFSFMIYQNNLRVAVTVGEGSGVMARLKQIQAASRGEIGSPLPAYSLNMHTESLQGVPLRIVLPGGGIRGAFQIGFLKSLMNSRRYPVDWVYGSSVGSIVAPFVIANKLNELEYLITSLKSPNDVVQPRSQILNDLLKLKYTSLSVLFKASAYQKFTIVDIALAMLENDQYAFNKCTCVAWDMMKRKEVWFTGKDYPDGMRASSALWLAVPPMKYKYPNGEQTYLVDGGATELVPVSKILEDEKAAEFDGKYLVVFPYLKQEPELKELPSNGLSLSIALHQDASNALSEREFEMFLNKVGDKAIAVYPQRDPFAWALDVNQKKILEYVNHGANTFEQLARAGIL